MHKARASFQRLAFGGRKDSMSNSTEDFEGSTTYHQLVDSPDKNKHQFPPRPIPSSSAPPPNQNRRPFPIKKVKLDSEDWDLCDQADARRSLKDGFNQGHLSKDDYLANDAELAWIAAKNERLTGLHSCLQETIDALRRMHGDFGRMKDIYDDMKSGLENLVELWSLIESYETRRTVWTQGDGSRSDEEVLPAQKEFMHEDAATGSHGIHELPASRSNGRSYDGED